MTTWLSLTLGQDSKVTTRLLCICCLLSLYGVQKEAGCLASALHATCFIATSCSIGHRYMDSATRAGRQTQNNPLRGMSSGPNDDLLPTDTDMAVTRVSGQLIGSADRILFMAGILLGTEFILPFDMACWYCWYSGERFYDSSWVSKRGK